MYTITIILITILIPYIQSVAVRSSLKLTFTPDNKYMSVGQDVDIKCELLNPADPSDSAQLFHIDLKTQKKSLVSRQLLLGPPEDAPDIFKKKNGRYSYVSRGHIHIQNLQAEDSARYVCDCPDCLEALTTATRNLSVMVLNQPTWTAGPGWPLHENTKSNLKCEVNNFFPYVGHKILRNHIDITNEGKSSLPSANVYPQTFTWEASLSFTHDMHNSTLLCIVTQGLKFSSSKKIFLLICFFFIIK